MQLDFIKASGKKVQIYLQRGTLEGVRNKSLDCLHEVLNRIITSQASPVLIHLMMACGVGVYAILGAVVIRELETKRSQDKIQSSDIHHKAEALDYKDVETWSFTSSLLFAFTLITTIGYGNVAPKTIGGRAFVIAYSVVGIPFTLLAIADLGKFISGFITWSTKAVFKVTMRLQKGWSSISKAKVSYIRVNTSDNAALEKTQNEEKTNALEANKATDSLCDSSETNREISQAVPLCIFFIVYLALGALMLLLYEPDMNFFKAIYFNFISLTSIGLGDVVPRSETFMALTMVYITVGLALTTIAIDIAADTLKRLHYYGRKIENVGSVAIWFGGKKLTVKALVKNLADHLNLPSTMVAALDLDSFVNQAIRVEEGHLKSLRPPPFSPAPDSFGNVYVDEVVDEQWLRDPTPSPSPTPPEPVASTMPVEVTQGPLPEPVHHKEDLQAPNSFEDQSLSAETEDVSTSCAMYTAAPDPLTPQEDTSPPTPPPPSSPENEAVPQPEPIRTPPSVVEELVPDPEQEPVSYAESVPLIEAEPEPERLVKQKREPLSKVKGRRYTAPEADHAKRRYSEDARRRYEEYQKEWQKLARKQRLGGPPKTAHGGAEPRPVQPKKFTISQHHGVDT